MGFTYLAYNNQSIKDIIGQTWVVITASVLLLAMTIFIYCFTETFRKFALPIFIIFTIVFSVVVASVVSAYDSKTVLAAAALTAAVVVGLTAYACKYLLTYRLDKDRFHKFRTLFACRLYHPFSLRNYGSTDRFAHSELDLLCVGYYFVQRISDL